MATDRQLLFKAMALPPGGFGAVCHHNANVGCWEWHDFQARLNFSFPTILNFYDVLSVTLTNKNTDCSSVVTMETRREKKSLDVTPSAQWALVTRSNMGGRAQSQHQEPMVLVLVPVSSHGKNYWLPNLTWGPSQILFRLILAQENDQTLIIIKSAHIWLSKLRSCICNVRSH